MNIDLNYIGEKYVQLNIEVDSATITTSVIGSEEAKEVREHLLDVIGDLSSYIRNSK